uniref:DUF4139 domain-containing protein n=1 Tax=Pelomonas sp. KK5 TaxID=1855730 RepID=UPI00117F9BBC
PWTLDLQPPLPPAAPAPVFARAAAPMAMMKEARAAEPELSFDVSVFEGEFATEFEVPGQVDVAANGQRVAFALGATPLETKLMARSNPQADTNAYLVAESARPAGVWPAGTLQLFRDGAFVGQSRLQVGTDNERLDLFFGRDEMVRVSVDPEARNAGSSGFIGSRQEQKISHVYRVENRHRRAFPVQILEASPVARHEDIKVQAAFDPAPSQQAWRKQPGIVAWDFTLEPGATKALKADYQISWPKDQRLNGMR